MIVEVLLALAGIVFVLGALYSLVRPRDQDEEPATLEGGSSHLRS
jgi:hypothetical protein